MSRNTSKNQAEKVTSAKPPPPTQAEDVEDSVDLGCLTKSEFLTMIAHEEGEEIVSDILDELMTNVMEKCYEVYLKKQIVPFTAAWAKNTILQMVKWQYLMRDEGDDVDTTSLLQEDTAPAPSIPDSWAEGCVPVIKISNHLQRVKTDAQEANIKDPQKILEAQSINKTESPPGKPRRNSRTLKVIPASHAKMELERKPHPPETRSSNKLKPPETQNILRY
ncbi:uncharacterized protein C2orf81 homolog [Ictalurus punctatus]|uniref:Uncharacterized protein C2orf81 homolog n=1 Tax=Ictalurus punctatus TaxID=7998 RepID=A0A2D0PQG9_ICTPU|nr:uncharacterized protein C2orf81 homolog [Ictalurus punctatus]XP_017307687.1 uncharacterized protein C2orf81 homolog [Ictalurus punctatus]